MDISTDVIRLIEGIRDNRTDGASELARQAAKVLGIAAEGSPASSTRDFLLEQAEIGRRLTTTRPAMAPIYNIVSRVLGIIDRKTKRMELNEVRRMIISRVDEVIDESVKAVEQIAGNFSRLVAEGDRILTHSYSSTVIAALREAAAKHEGIEVIVTRSGPGRTWHSNRSVKVCLA